MSATLELKYFNTFWLKKIKSIAEQGSIAPAVPPAIGVQYTNITYPNVPQGFAGAPATEWFIEESRIRGGYNNTSVDFGVKAYIASDNPNQQHLFSSLIYSGIFNSRTGVNNTNQFSVGEDITKTIDPVYGEIQKLYAEDTNLIIFQEDKVHKALIDKDAIYSAEGNATLTSSPAVIGQVVAYAGEYGISTDPFSFAVYGYRKYFTDRKRNCVCRLSRDGITEISSYGMHDFFRDELSNILNTKIVGGFDVHTKSYIVSIQQPFNTSLPNVPIQANYNTQIPQPTAADRSIPAVDTYKTLAFDESVLGWTSFFSYKPGFFTSLGANFYSFFSGGIWLHHSQTRTVDSAIIVNNYGSFYNAIYNSDVTLVLNSTPSVVKNFKTINYEGNNGWFLDSMISSSGDSALPIAKYVAIQNYGDLQNNMFANNFKRKENKYFANILQDKTGSVVPQDGEILWGYEVGGLKGFFSTVKMAVLNPTVAQAEEASSGKRELFSVSSTIVESSY